MSTTVQARKRSFVRRLLAATKFALIPGLLAVASAAILTALFSNLKLSLKSDVNINVLLPLKAGLIGVVAAALLAFWGFFWTEVVAQNTELNDLPAIVRSYRQSFAYFVPALMLLFASTGADFYLLFASSGRDQATAFSFATLAAALVMILVFVVLFSSRTLVEMNELLQAGEVKLPPAHATEHEHEGH